MAGSGGIEVDADQNGVGHEGANGKLSLAQKKRLKQKQRKQARKAER
jgi:hypothetical protein